MCIKQDKSMALSQASHGITKPKKKLIIKPSHAQTFQVKRKNAITVNELLTIFLSAAVGTVKRDNESEVRRRENEANEVQKGTRAFIEIMKHSIKCRSCDDTKCKKMKMVMSHYIKCTKLKNGESCLLCRQLLRVVAEHALYLCPSRLDGPKLPCPVPMCDVMRASAALKNLN